MKMKLVTIAVLGLVVSTMSMADVSKVATSTTTNLEHEATQPTTSSNIQLTTDKAKLSYSIGYDLGKNFKRQGIEIDPTILAHGFEDSLNNATPILSEENVKDTLNKFQKDLMSKRNAEFIKKSEENKKLGETFLSVNKAKAGVITLASGLQYKIIQKGTGVKPMKDDTVTVDYTGQLINNEVFDSTEKSGKPASFKVSQVIPGWIEALQLMPAGSTWEIYVPANLAYGSRSMGGPIGPNETLIFKIHLISVKK